MKPTQRLTFSTDKELIAENLIAVLQESDYIWETGFGKGGGRVILVDATADETIELINKANS